MNIQLPGRKATIIGAVIGFLIYGVLEGKFEGETLNFVLWIICGLAIVYTVANVVQKAVLPVELNPPDDDGAGLETLTRQVDNLRANIIDVEKKADIAVANIPKPEVPTSG